jgi:hypothetical protein
MLIVQVATNAIGVSVERMVATAAGRGVTIQIRVLETEGAFTAILESGGLGSGLGGTFEFLNAEDGVREKTTFVHNGFVQLLLKLGVIGLLLFLLLIVAVERQAVLLLARGHPWSEGLVGLLGALNAVLVLSLAVNKLFALSGAMFIGVACALIQSAKIGADAEVRARDGNDVMGRVARVDCRQRRRPTVAPHASGLLSRKTRRVAVAEA